MNSHYAAEMPWLGGLDRECGEHQEASGRSWCLDCSQWCYEVDPCVRCELGRLRALVRQLEGDNEVLHQIHQQERLRSEFQRQVWAGVSYEPLDCPEWPQERGEVTP
jgi:hypothetical protein